MVQTAGWVEGSAGLATSDSADTGQSCTGGGAGALVLAGSDRIVCGSHAKGRRLPSQQWIIRAGVERTQQGDVVGLMGELEFGTAGWFAAQHLRVVDEVLA